MEVKPGYKQTEIGVIPQEWKTVSVSDVSNRILDFRGRTPRKIGMDWGNGDIPALSAGNVKMGYIDFNEECYFGSEALYQRWMTNGHAKKGDICFTTEAPLGNVAQIPDSRKYILSQRTVLFQPNPILVFGEYLFQFLKSDYFQKILAENATGSTAKGIKRKRLEKLLVVCPPLHEQRVIATALSDMDALLSKLDQLITKKRDLKQAVMQQLLTGQTRLPGFRKVWEVKRFSEICQMKSGDGITSADIDESSKFPCYGGNGLRGYTNRYTHEGVYALIGRQGALCGNVLSVGGQFFASEHAIVVTPFNGTDIRWLATVLERMNLNQYSESSAQPGLSVSRLLSFSSRVPPLEEQAAIAKVLSEMDVELTVLEARRDKTYALKQGMMQQLLTGKIRLI